MSSGYSGKSGFGDGQDFHYNPDMAKYMVKPRPSVRARVESCLFYGICIGAIIAMFIFVLGH